MPFGVDCVERHNPRICAVENWDPAPLLCGYRIVDYYHWLPTSGGEFDSHYPLNYFYLSHLVEGLLQFPLSSVDCVV